MKPYIIYPDGRYPFAAGAAQEPGDVIVRPSGSLAVMDGLEGVASGAMISPDPVHPFPIGEWPCASGDTWSAADVLYWDSTAKEVTTTSTNNTRVGNSCVAKTAGMTKILVEHTDD